MLIADVSHYITSCAPQVSNSTLMAIVKTESSYNHLALNLNRGKHLRFQPHNLDQAVGWANYLEHNNYDFDIGLGQVNIRNVHTYGFKARDMFDPCKNLFLASIILKKTYVDALKISNNQHDALFRAISAYNTGNFHGGFHNGYVRRVVSNAYLTSYSP